MKKVLTITGTIIVSLIITFLLAETFSLYHFGDIPTITTFIYLIILFSIIIYILSSLIYIISKKMKKEKIGIKKIISILLFFMSLILILGFVVTLNVDWLNYYSRYEANPFYVYILQRGLEFLLPAVVLIVVGILLLRKDDKK